MPIDVSTLGVELQLVIKAANARQSTKYITPKASSQYTRSVIKRVNSLEDSHDKQRRNSRTGLLKVSSIKNNRARQSDPRLAWMMFYKIAQIYRYIREQESEEATELILNLHANLNSNNTTLSSPRTPKISIQQPTMPLDPKTVPKDLKEIQPRLSQVWNCDEIGFDPNVSWLRVVCTYKFFTGKRMWKSQTGERAPFWCTALIFARADGQCFMPPMIVRQADNYTQYLHWNLLSDWLVYNLPSGYIDRDLWMKETSLFSRTC